MPKTVGLIVDPSSLRRSRLGTISGQIYLQTTQGAFPGLGWSDIVIPFLCAWLNAILKLCAGQRETERVDFFDGPYCAYLRRLDSNSISILMVEDRQDGKQQSVEIPTGELLRNAASSSSQILAECRHRGWSDSDIRKLQKLHGATQKLINESQ
jgi:hypothetical protein